MHDPVEIRRRIESLRERLARRGDYGELLANGHVVRWPDDIAAWRAAIRAQARADRIKVRTGSGGCGVWALLVRRPDEDTGDDEYWVAYKNMVATSLALGHESAFGARHGPEILFYCERCPALGYADAEDDVTGGSLLLIWTSFCQAGSTGCPRRGGHRCRSRRRRVRRVRDARSD